MSSEGRGVGNESQEPLHAQRAVETLQGCLIGADPEQVKHEARVRRRALVLSTLLQAAFVLAVIAIPFFGKVERIAFANVMPLPPYHAPGVAREHATTAAPRPGPHNTFCLLCPLAPPRPHSSDGNGGDKPSPGQPDGPEGFGSSGGEACISGCIPIGKSDGPIPPQTQATKPPIVHMTHIDPALLLKRIEPVYPPLAIQMRREGRVELHAIISTDGTIESLEVVSGDLFFIQSALTAVRQWRYRPTMLNGQPVIVDTYISVIYSMQK
jgi:periplasmic protein TonB